MAEIKGKKSTGVPYEAAAVKAASPVEVQSNTTPTEETPLSGLGAAEELTGAPRAPKVKSDKVIECKNLVKTYNGATVVDDINLNIKRGEFVTLLGPSGCGKTTTLRMIAGFEKPDSGRILIEGADVTDVPPHLRNVNTVFQRYALFPHLNVHGNIAFGLKQKRIPAGTAVTKNGVTRELTRKYTKDEINGMVEEVLKMVNLENYGHRYVDTLSGGQQQRVAIARALVNKPKVLLLDEPLSALDAKMRKEMQIELMRMHRELKITFVFVTHDQEEALTMSDTVIVMSDGVIQQIGTPKKIYDEPTNAFVANFIGESNIMSGVMLEDFRVRFADRVFECVDKGFEKNEPVDLVIRPEDIYLVDPQNPKAMLQGEVISSIFKGDYYELDVSTGDYEFSVQETNGWEVGQKVALYIGKNDIHIMKKSRITNEFVTAFARENKEDARPYVTICGVGVECEKPSDIEYGASVKANIAFDDIELYDDEEDGILGGNITSIVYKGTHYQVIVRTDDEDEFYVNTPDEWDMSDRVGLGFSAGKLTFSAVEAAQEADGAQEVSK